MATAIEWAGSSINFVTGCQRISQECSACYAERITATRLSHKPKYAGLTDAKKRFTGEVRFHPEVLDALLRKRKGELYFVNSMSDTFHKDVQDAWLDRAFATFAATPQHCYLLLTKRADRMRQYLALDSNGQWCRGNHYPMPLPNVALGVSCGLQESVHRIADLCQTPAAYRFVSVEPLLGPVCLEWQREPRTIEEANAWGTGVPEFPRVNQVIIGCESHGPRLGRLFVGDTMRALGLEHDIKTWLGWACDLADQCRAAGVRVFVKQIPSQDGRLLHARHAEPFHDDWHLWPEALRSWQTLPWSDDHA